MGVIFEAIFGTVFDLLWIGFILKLKQRGPWWLWMVVAASPLLLLLLLIGLVFALGAWA